MTAKKSKPAKKSKSAQRNSEWPKILEALFPRIDDAKNDQELSAITAGFVKVLSEKWEQFTSPSLSDVVTISCSFKLNRDKSEAETKITRSGDKIEGKAVIEIGNPNQLNLFGEE